MSTPASPNGAHAPRAGAAAGPKHSAARRARGELLEHARTQAGVAVRALYQTSGEPTREDLLDADLALDQAHGAVARLLNRRALRP
jgi:hypothetical protein